MSILSVYCLLHCRCFAAAGCKILKGGQKKSSNTKTKTFILYKICFFCDVSLDDTSLRNIFLGWLRKNKTLFNSQTQNKKTTLASSSVWSHRLTCFPRLDVRPGMYRQQHCNKALPPHRLRLIKLKKSEQQNITPMFGNNTITHFEKKTNNKDFPQSHGTISTVIPWFHLHTRQFCVSKPPLPFPLAGCMKRGCHRPLTAMIKQTTKKNNPHTGL